MANEKHNEQGNTGNKQPGATSQKNGRGGNNKSPRNNASARQRTELRETEFTPGQGQIAVLVPAKSEVVDRYMTFTGTRTSSSMIRIGTLIKITLNNNDEESRNKIMVWLDDMIESIRQEVVAVSSMVDEQVKMAQLDGIELPELVPFNSGEERYCYANHPALVKLLRELSKIDSLALMVDRLWFAGIIDDKQKAMSSKQLTHPFYSAVDLIAKVTDIGGRKGGRYNPAVFMAVLKQEESIAAMIEKYIKSKPAVLTRTEQDGVEMIQTNIITPEPVAE